ncbi:PhzF family phenazine biosynthesis protein [Oceanicoccus sp. KOV_DT_Chl]|uniref:PhzF family phenazine biosynthesis protein n=1 Tax=Oceanicoccus sp. KOV_DT_Chl TaxID=1904639 RepID=UPI0011AF3D03|nr:PhzF family phenazine biosynthesis protein [Oceanicoccus sp. KOV_DT_Chl]
MMRKVAIQGRNQRDIHSSSNHLLITAFTGSGVNQHLHGNPCLLLVDQHQPPHPPAPIDALSQCQSWPVVHQTNTAIAVRCFTACGQLIHCCGHGLLAAAYYWQRQLNSSQLTLLMNDSEVQSWSEAEQTWLRFNRLAVNSYPVPDWVSTVFPNQPAPLAAAVIGDDQGYLVVEWPANVPLKTLTAPGHKLTAASQRALICTSVQHAKQRAAEIQLRYFAPQYGVDEDIATGSAMRVLAAYFSPRFERLEAEQCSPAGGQLLSRISATAIDIGGRCIEHNNQD